MDGLLKEVAAAARGDGIGGPALGSAGPRLISEMTAPAAATAAGGAPAPADESNAPSLEEQRQMLSFLLSLEELRTSDPAAFEQTMGQLGIGNAVAPGASAKDKEQSQSDALKTLIQSLKSSDVSSDAAAAATGVAPGIVMPGANKNAPKGITITPTPGYVIKTRQVADETKVFITLCSHELIDPPGLKKRLDENGEPVEGMNIPMSVGAGRTGVAKAGASCRVYDIIVNPQVVADGLSDKSGKYRDFVAQLCIQSVEQKYRSELDRRYKLPIIKNNYMGEGDSGVESQMIQDRKAMPKIEEVAADSPAARAAAAARVKKQAEDARLVREAMAAVETALTYRLRWVHGNGTGTGTGTGDDAEEEDIAKAAEHVDPIVVPADSVSELAFTADVAAAAFAPLSPSPSSSSSSSLDLSKVEVKLSPFKLSVKLPGHRLATLFLPCAVLPCGVRCSLRRKEGYAQRLELRIGMPVDRQPWHAGPDAGSKQWLVTNALRSGGDDEAAFNPYDSSAVEAAAAEDAAAASASAAAKAAAADERLAEDRFHIRLPSNVDPYTGQRLDGGAAKGSGSGGAELDDVELPEDRFHRKDAASQFIIQQREQAVKEKWDKHAKEKAERVNDPNVEYVDVEDYRPGGKYGPKSSAGAAVADSDPGAEQGAGVGEAAGPRQELKKASQVVASLAPTGPAVSLSSTVWTELCD